MMGFDNGMGYGWMGLFWILLILGVILLSILLVRALSGGIDNTSRGSESRQPSERGRGAREILDERYARGELNTDEYNERRRSLDDGDR